MQRGIQEEVDRRVAVAGLGLLAVLDQARDRAIDLDRQAGGLGLVGPREALDWRTPPARDLWGAVYTRQLGLILRSEGAEGQVAVVG